VTIPRCSQMDERLKTQRRGARRGIPVARTALAELGENVISNALLDTVNRLGREDVPSANAAREASSASFGSPSTATTSRSRRLRTGPRGCSTSRPSTPPTRPRSSLTKCAEMLDDVRDVRIRWRDFRALEPAVESSARRPHKRVPLDVLAITRLLADEHHARRARAFAHHRLRGVLVEVTRPALLHRRSQVGQRRTAGDRRRRAIVHRTDLPRR